MVSYTNFNLVNIAFGWELMMFFFFFFDRKHVNFIELKLKYNREKAKALQTEFLNNNMLNRTWNSPFPNLWLISDPSNFCKFMGNSVAFPFQMMKGAPAKNIRDFPNILDNVTELTTKDPIIDSLNNGQGIRLNNSMRNLHFRC